MRTNFIGLFILFVITSVLLAGEIGADGVLKDKTVYVWNFDAKDAGSNDLAESVTDEFEQALIKSRACIVLQRRHYKKLFDQRQQEQGRKGLEGFDKKLIETFKSRDAELVIFGEVHDDNASGQIKISAYIQDFDTKILASENVYGPRSIKLDPQSRMEYVIKLVGMLASSGNEQQKSEPNKESPNVKKELPIAKTVADLRVTLTEVILNGTNLEINFELVNRAQTREVSFEQGFTTLYDDTGREFKPTKVTIGELKAKKTLVPGVPVNMKISFQGVFDEVIWIPQLNLKFYMDGWHDLIFNDLRIPR